MRAEANDIQLETFIPFRRSDLIEICLKDQRLDIETARQFKEFCQILAAFYHFQAHATLERLKGDYSPFNPDSETRQAGPNTPSQLQKCAENLVTGFSGLLEEANYRPLLQQDLEKSFESASLIPLQTKVDFDDFEQVLFYARGQGQKTVQVKQFLRKKELLIDNFERVAVLLKFRDLKHFESKQQRLDELGFVPGKTYLYLYKNIPLNDLELLFPNVEVSMNWKDRWILLITALGAGIPLTIKVLPSLGLLFAAVLLMTMGPEFAARFGIKTESSAGIYPLLAAVLSMGAMLGGFAVRQYNKYKSKRLQFLKTVTDTLFFKNMVTNEGVLYSLTDAAEEELCKEVILVYYHLLTSPASLDRAQLDQKIEAWMQTSFGFKIDFDIDKTLQNLAEIQAEPVDSTGVPQKRALLTRQSDGRIQALSLPEAKQLIDHIWDKAFTYADG